MEFLKEILGDDLYGQLESKVNEYNGNEANKDKKVKIGNLGTGDYVASGKYKALEEQITGKDNELTEANKLISELKKATEGESELQNKIGQYETTVEDLQKQLAETKVKSALKVALLSEKAKDVDYLSYKINEKLNEKGEALEVDENGNIKGWDDTAKALKAQYPSMFENAAGKKFEERRLPDGDGNGGSEPKDLAEALMQQYENKE